MLSEMGKEIPAILASATALRELNFEIFPSNSLDLGTLKPRDSSMSSTM